MAPAKRFPSRTSVQAPASGVSGERPALRSPTRLRADVELSCGTRERLEKLYRDKLLRRTMLLPPDATRARGAATICVRLPSGEELWLRATVTSVQAGTERAIRLDFDELTDVQRRLVESVLGSAG